MAVPAIYVIQLARARLFINHIPTLVWLVEVRRDIWPRENECKTTLFIVRQWPEYA